MLVTPREAIRAALFEEMKHDDRVFMMGEDVAKYNGIYKVSKGLLDEFGPKRVVDTPITEHALTGMGAGAAMAGLRPIVEFMTFNFAMQAMDQIVNTIAKTHYMTGGTVGCPIVLRGVNGLAKRTAAQHAQCFASWYANIPGLKVVVPYFPADAKALLKASIRDANPVVFLESELWYGLEFDEELGGEDDIAEIGKAKVVREGKDITLVSFSYAMKATLAAAEELAKEGIDAEVIDLRTLRPFDKETVIESVKKTNRCVVVQDGYPFASVGSEVASILMEEAFDYLDAPVTKLSSVDVPLPYADNLEAASTPNAEKIINTVKEICCNK